MGLLSDIDGILGKMGGCHPEYLYAHRENNICGEFSSTPNNTLLGGPGGNEITTATSGASDPDTGCLFDLVRRQRMKRSMYDNDGQGNADYSKDDGDDDDDDEDDNDPDKNHIPGTRGEAVRA